MNDVKKLFLQYFSGFTLSLCLTLLAYYVATSRSASSGSVLLIVSILAIIQLVVQLVLFLHIGEDAKPRVRLLSFGFTILILFIVVGGSIWIMSHLNYNMMHMSPSEKEYYMTSQKDKGF